VIAALGWALSFGLLLVVVRLRGCLAQVAEAAHEIRGPAAALALAVASLRREAGGVRRALRFETELERMRIGLADLDAARVGRRAAGRPATVALERFVKGMAAGWEPAATRPGREVRVNWEAGHAWVRADRGRLAQALGNLMANAVEHGSGPIEVRAVRKGRGAVRVEVKDAGPAAAAGPRPLPSRDRGRGLRIAARAIRDAGGTLTLDRGHDGTTAAIELPLEGEARDR
jgi:signal transduction histidine kinase